MPYTDADIEQLIRQMATSKDVEDTGDNDPEPSMT